MDKIIEDNIKVSKEKAKCLTICKEYLQVYMVEQVMTFKYLGVNTFSARDIQAEIKEQVIKGATATGCLRDIICRAEFKHRRMMR